MNLDLLDDHYRTAEGLAFEEYRDKREWQELEYFRGLMTREEYREVVEEVRRAEENYAAAMMRHARVFRRLYLGVNVAQQLMRLLEKLTSDTPDPVTVPPRAESDHAPPLHKLAHSITSHGPPSYAALIASRLSYSVP